MASSTPTDIQTDVYFIRHGIAAERGTYANDDERPLIEKGIRKTQQVAQRLRALGIHFDCLLASPLVRAQQTADLLQQAGLCHQVQTFVPLAPSGLLEDWLIWLETWQSAAAGCLALVGHEPDLSQWAQQLVASQVHDRWVLKKAGILGLRLPQARIAQGNSELFLLVSPKFFINP